MSSRHDELSVTFLIFDNLVLQVPITECKTLQKQQIMQMNEKRHGPPCTDEGYPHCFFISKSKSDSASLLYLSLRGVEGPPVVGFELVQLIKLQADILNGELEHIPEPCEILSHRPWVSVWVLLSQNK